MTDRGLSPGFLVGHWTDADAGTGCTVVLPPRGNVTSCDIRGSSPSTRELAHLDPNRKLTEVHGILLAGGSAYGLAAADGVVAWLEQRDTGYATPIGPVPIVPGAVIFDMAARRGGTRADAGAGRAACEAAGETSARGRVGAGTGATVGKWDGPERAHPGGLGVATAEGGGLEVSALAVVNSVGDVLDRDGRVLAGSGASQKVERRAGLKDFNTVLVVVTMVANVGKRSVRWLASRGNDGITVAVRPAHTRYDGDVVFAVAAPDPTTETPAPDEDLDVLGRLATEAVADAVRDAVDPKHG